MESKDNEGTGVEGTFVGVVLGRRSSTPTEFWIAVDKKYPLQLDDTVYVEDEIYLPDENGKGEQERVKIKFYGIVDLVEKSYEGLDFDSDMYHIKDIPVEERHVAHVNITRIEPEYFVPPSPNLPVFLAKERDFEKAIGADNMRRKIPAGLSHNGSPVFIDMDYIDGKKGAHVSISGVSGVAAKTTYGVFLMQSIMYEDSKGPRKFAGIIFNVKGEDLLFIDKPNREFYEADESVRAERQEEWHKLSPEFYEEFIKTRKIFTRGVYDIEFFAPPRKGVQKLIPDVSQRDEKETETLAWNFFEFAKFRLMNFITSEDDPESVRMLAQIVSEALYRKAEETEKKYGKRDKLNFVDVGGGKCISDLKGFRDFLSKVNEGKTSEYSTWFPKDFSSATTRAFLNRLTRAVVSAGHLINPNAHGIYEKIAFIKPGNLFVIHIGDLDWWSSKFVVGAVLSRIFQEQEQRGGAWRKVVILLDELSKYAPREGESPLKSILEDIAERGRSLGIILIGAQQSASSVSRKIILNSSVKVVGRMSAEEVEAKEYGFLSVEMKRRLLVAKPGRVIISQPEVYAPVPVRFPFPFWATRRDEAILSDLKEEALKDIEMMM